MIKNIINFGKSLLKEALAQSFTAVQPTIELELLHDGRTAHEVIKKRVMRRYNEKCKEVNIDPKLYKAHSFEAIFNLPKEISFNIWMHLQLRGRPVDDLFILNLDHIVPISIATTFEELLILFSWKNTRLANPDMNTAKGSHLDPENILLCQRLLGREPPSNWDGTIGAIVEPVEPKVFKSKIDNTDRFEKLLQSKGKMPSKPIYGKNTGSKRRK